MLKTKIIHIIIAFCLIIYIITTIYFVSLFSKTQKCSNVLIKIVSPNNVCYLSESRIRTYLDQGNVHLKGENISNINTKRIKTILQKNKLIKNIKIYKTIESIIKIEIEERTPILRIISKNSDYYLDNEKKIIPIQNGLIADLPIATGSITKKYAQKQLYAFAVFLKKNVFWHSQIDQIYVYPNLEIELIPYVGKHCILLGEINNFELKLNNLKHFYEHYINKIGWNRYSTISLKYENQILCTKID